MAMRKIDIERTAEVMAPFVVKAKADVEGFTDPQEFYDKMSPATAELYDTVAEAIDEYVGDNGFSLRPKAGDIVVLNEEEKPVYRIKIVAEVRAFMKALRSGETFEDIYNAMEVWYDKVFTDNSITQ